MGLHERRLRPGLDDVAPSGASRGVGPAGAGLEGAGEGHPGLCESSSGNHFCGWSRWWYGFDAFSF